MIDKNDPAALPLKGQELDLKWDIKERQERAQKRQTGTSRWVFELIAVIGSIIAAAFLLVGSIKGVTPELKEVFESLDTWGCIAAVVAAVAGGLALNLSRK